MEEFAFSRALEAVWRFLAQINGYIVAKEPWKVRKEEGPSSRLARILYAAAEGGAPRGRPPLAVHAGHLAEDLRDARAARRRPAPGGPRLGRACPSARRFPRAAPLFPARGRRGVFRVEGRTVSTKAEVHAHGPAHAESAKDVTPPVETTQAVSPSDNRIDLDEFKKVRLVTGRVLAAERVPKSKKLVRLDVDLGTERRQIVAGIAARYEPEALVGRNVVIVANLKPATLMGVESNGMVLAATVGEAGEPSLLEVAGGRAAGEPGQVICDWRLVICDQGGRERSRLR